MPQAQAEEDGQPAFKKGDRVTHPKFGDGEVLEVQGERLTIAFDAMGHKRVLSSFVKPAPANDNNASKAPIITVHQFELKGTSNVPRRQFLYGHHLIRKYMAVLFAAGGLGKTSLLTSEALAMVTGRPLLHEKPERPLRVWYVNAEDSLEEIERKFEATAAHFRIGAGDIGGRLFLSSGRDSNFVVAMDGRNGVQIQAPVVKAVFDHADRNKIDVIIVDPFVSTHQVNENDNGAIQFVAMLWLQIADAVGCAIELAHHISKGGNEVTEDSGRGAGALKDKARAVRTLNRMTPTEAEKWDVPPGEHRSYFRFDMPKANLAKAGGHSSWFRFVSIPMNNGDGPHKPQDHTGVVERWSPPSEDDTASSKAERDKALRNELVAEVPSEVLHGIKTRLGSGDYKESEQATHWAGYLVADLLGINLDDQGARGRVKSMLAAWVASGDLRIVRLPDANRRVTPHVKPGCGTTQIVVPQM